MKKVVMVVCFLLGVNSLVSGSEKPKAIERIPLITASLDGDKNFDRVEVKKIVFTPLQKTGLHRHPCPVVGYIVDGTALFQIEGETLKTLKTGDAFFEPPNQKILRFDNASDSKPLTFIANYLLGKGEKTLIEMLE